MPLPWEDWVPGLNNDHLTLREVFDTLPGAAPNEIAWHVRLLENPISPIALPGAIELHPHDCVHILLGRGLMNQDEAFIIGYTMGTNKDLARWKIWLFKKLAQYFYPEPYKFSKSDALAFKLGVGRGLACKVKNIQDLPLFTDKYLDRKISDIRKELGISVPELRAWYRKEKILIPDTKESLRLPVDRGITTTRLARPEGRDSDWERQ